MDIIVTLTIRHMKKNKKRTVSTITGIFISAVLLSMAFLFISSYLRMLADSDITAEDIAPLAIAAAVMMAVILAVLAIFVHNMLSISAQDRIRYIGLLASVGATPMQRGQLSVLESVIVGGIGIFPGVAVGCVLSSLISPFSVEISWKSVLSVILCEGLTILLTGLFHTFSSRKSRVIELVQNRTDKRYLKKLVELPGWILSRFGIEGHFAAKNIIFYKRRYLAVGLSFAIAMVLLLNGFIYMNYLDGYYQVRDLREKIVADVIVEEEYDKKSDKWDVFTEEITALPEVEQYKISKRAEFGGILFPADAIDPRMVSFSTGMLGTFYENPTRIYDKEDREKKGYCMGMTLVGLDDAAFASYLKKAGVNRDGIRETDVLPILIEDFPLVRTAKDFRYRSVLDIKSNSELDVWTDMDRHMIGASPERNPITEFEKLSVHVLGVTDKRPELVDVNEGVLEDENTLRFYTTMEGFDKFMAEHPLNEESGSVTRSVALSMKSKVPHLSGDIVYPAVTQFGNTITRQLKLSADGLSILSDDPFQRQLKVRNEEAGRLQKHIRLIGEKYNLSDGSNMPLENYDPAKIDFSCNPYPVMVLGAMSDPFPLLRHLFLYGIFAFILIISLFQMLKMAMSAVQIRRREFAVLLSLGMNRRQLGKMLCIESLICNVGAFLTGLIVSSFITFVMFVSWRKTQAVEVSFPYWILMLEFALFVGVTSFTIGLSIRSVKKVKVIDIIKNDTV